MVPDNYYRRQNTEPRSRVENIRAPTSDSLKKSYKLTSVIKYPKFDKAGAEIPKLFFEKFISIIDMNLSYGSLDDIPIMHIAYLLADAIISKDKSARFLDLAKQARNLGELGFFFEEAVKVPELLQQRRFETIDKKPDGVTWSEFVGDLSNKFENTYKSQNKQDGSNEFLIATLMKTIPKNLKAQLQGYLLTVKRRNVYDIAEKLDLLQANMDAESISDTLHNLKLNKNSSNKNKQQINNISSSLNKNQQNQTKDSRKANENQKGNTNNDRGWIKNENFDSKQDNTYKNNRGFQNQNYRKNGYNQKPYQNKNSGNNHFNNFRRNENNHNNNNENFDGQIPFQFNGYENYFYPGLCMSMYPFGNPFQNFNQMPRTNGYGQYRGNYGRNGNYRGNGRTNFPRGNKQNQNFNSNQNYRNTNFERSYNNNNNWNSNRYGQNSRDRDNNNRNANDYFPFQRDN